MLGIKPRIAHPVISVVTGDCYLRTNISVGLRGLEKLIVSQLVTKFSILESVLRYFHWCLFRA
jgi:hypothetical protein